MDGQEFALLQSFYIDTDAYSDRDRLMFACGCEFQMIREKLLDPTYLGGTIHRENESRIRMMAGKLRRVVDIRPCEPEHDPDGTWSYLNVRTETGLNTFDDGSK